MNDHSDWQTRFGADGRLPYADGWLNVRKLAPMLWNKPGVPSPNTLRDW
jgi:hypothetical protein